MELEVVDTEKNPPLLSIGEKWMKFTNYKFTLIIKGNG